MPLIKIFVLDKIRGESMSVTDIKIEKDTLKLKEMYYKELRDKVYKNYVFEFEDRIISKFWATIKKDDNKCIIEYITDKKYRGKGLATLGLRILCEKIFSDLSIKTIELKIDNGNIASEKVAKNNNFEKGEENIYYKINPNFKINIDKKMILEKESVNLELVYI